MTLRALVIWIQIGLSPLYAETFFVGPGGRGGSPGTEEQPFATIQEAVQRCGPGDECVVLPGTYRETVRLSKSGLPGKPILLRAAGEVVLDGTEPLPGPWERHEGNIVRTCLPGPVVEQVFSRGVPLSPARWPNARFEDTWIRSKWAASAEGSRKDLMICEALVKTGADWTGAIAVLNVGHQYKTWTRKILTHGKGKRSFTYALEERLGDGKVVEGLTDGYAGKAPDVGAYEYGKSRWRAGALRAEPPDIVLPIEAEVARSWKLEKSSSRFK